MGNAGKTLPPPSGRGILASGILQEVPFRWSPLMRLVTLFLIAAFAAATVDAASYQKTDGTIVDPIMIWFTMNIHYYSGANLEPYADLSKADLHQAVLLFADLRHANLSGANLWNANLTDADLTDADLTAAYLRYADLRDANLSGSNLTTVQWWHPAYWTGAYYYTNNEPNWHSDMDQARRDSEGILAIDPASGDINSDGVFDAADYTLWKDNGGDPIDYRGDLIDYRTWKDHFGQSSASGSGADHVPEPTTLLLALLPLVAAPLRVRHG